MDIDYNAVFGLDTPAEEAKESTDVAGGTDAGEACRGRCRRRRSGGRRS